MAVPNYTYLKMKMPGLNGVITVGSSIEHTVVKVLKPGTYKLANEDGEELTNAWNIQQLRRFYP
jgi:hypothetical protein